MSEQEVRSSAVTRALDSAMLMIQALDHNAHLDYSSWTRQWYVAARIEVGDGMLLSGGTEHRDDPHEAVDAYLSKLMAAQGEKYLVTRYLGRRREWRWNGAAFAECTREVVFEREAERELAGEERG